MFLSITEILRHIRQLGPLSSLSSGPLDGPAQRYVLQGARGEIGLIGALSHHFCHKCNRLRLTADGHLRGCLFSDQETDIKTPLRQGKGIHHLQGLIVDAIANKHANHGLSIHSPVNCLRSMNTIGG